MSLERPVIMNLSNEALFWFQIIFLFRLKLGGILVDWWWHVGPMMRANVSLILGAVSGYAAEFHLAKHPYFLDLFGDPPVDHLRDGDSPYRGVTLNKVQRVKKSENNALCP